MVRRADHLHPKTVPIPVQLARMGCVVKFVSERLEQGLFIAGVIKIIDDETLRLKLQEANPICLALIRGLAMRISDANEAAETYWRELSIYKSLTEKQNSYDQS